MFPISYLLNGKKKFPKASKLTTISTVGVEVWKVEDDHKMGLEAIAKQLTSENPNIEYAEPHYRYYIAQNPLQTDCTHEDLDLKNGIDDYSI